MRMHRSKCIVKDLRSKETMRLLLKSNIHDENIGDSVDGALEAEFELSILQAYIDTVWIKYDTDGNGTINVDETKQLLSDITGHESISHEECERFVKALDQQEKMKDHEINHVIDKDEFIFFVDDMMQMSIDDRKEYAARGLFQQILMDFANGIVNQFKNYQTEKMELYKQFSAYIFNNYADDKTKLTIKTCEVLLQDISSENSISNDIVQAFINQVRNEDEHLKDDEEESESTTSYDISEDQLHVYIVKVMCMDNEKKEIYGSQSSYHDFLLKVFKGINAKWKLYKEDDKDIQQEQQEEEEEEPVSI